jgi:hypothetical protein
MHFSTDSKWVTQYDSKPMSISFKWPSNYPFLAICIPMHQFCSNPSHGWPGKRTAWWTKYKWALVSWGLSPWGFKWTFGNPLQVCVTLAPKFQIDCYTRLESMTNFAPWLSHAFRIYMSCLPDYRMIINQSQCVHHSMVDPNPSDPLYDRLIPCPVWYKMYGSFPPSTGPIVQFRVPEYLYKFNVVHRSCHWCLMWKVGFV